MAKDDLVLFSKEFDGVEHLIVKDEFGIDRDFIRPNNIMVISENNTYPVADCKQVDGQLPPPTGKKLQIAENGEFTPDTYSGEYYNEVVVNMATELTDEEITITENGTYKPSTGHMFSRVTVDVPCDTMVGYDECGNPVTPYVDPITGKLEIAQLPDHINVTTPPAKTDYIPGDKIDYSGIVVTAYKKDGTIWDNPNYPNGVIPFNELIFPKEKLDGAMNDDGENIGVPLLIELKDAVTISGKEYKLKCFTNTWEMTGVEKNATLFFFDGLLYNNEKRIYNTVKSVRVEIGANTIGAVIWKGDPYDSLNKVNDCYRAYYTSKESSYVLADNVVSYWPLVIVASYSADDLEDSRLIYHTSGDENRLSKGSRYDDVEWLERNSLPFEEEAVDYGSIDYPVSVAGIHIKLLSTIPYRTSEYESLKTDMSFGYRSSRPGGGDISGVYFGSCSGICQAGSYDAQSHSYSYNHKMFEQQFSITATHDCVNDIIAAPKSYEETVGRIAVALMNNQKVYRNTNDIGDIHLMIYNAASDLDCGIEQPIKYSQCGKVVTDIADNKHYVYLLNGMRFSIAYSQGKAGFYYVAASDQPRANGKITVRQINNLNDNAVESEDVITITATTSFTHNEKTVYFTSGTITTKGAILGAAPVATDENAGLFRTHEGRIAWTIVFGNDENVDSYPCELPVRWKRPGDRKILEATTSVNVKLSRNVDTEL